MKILLTSATIPSFFEERKNEYQESIDFIKNHSLNGNSTIIETVLFEKSFLEEFDLEIFYSKTHNETIKNKGVKEIMALNSYFYNNKIDDNEMIIKMTGRYRFLSEKFIKEIQKDDFDAYYTTEGNQVFFGCFALRKKYLIEFINSIDLDEMEKNMINVEKKFYDFLQIKNNIKLKHIDKIDVYSKINNKVVVIW
jgi:hypothetical protein